MEPIQYEEVTELPMFTKWLWPKLPELPKNAQLILAGFENDVFGEVAGVIMTMLMKEGRWMSLKTCDIHTKILGYRYAHRQQDMIHALPRMVADGYFSAVNYEGLNYLVPTKKFAETALPQR